TRSRWPARWSFCFLSCWPNWDIKEIDKYMNYDGKHFNRDVMKKFFIRSSEKLGKMLEYKGCEENSFIAHLNGNYSAIYISSVKFKNDNDAKVQISLIREQNEWRINGIFINSKAYLE
ncbi:MAG: hypothetical protein WCL30_05960, partial [Pseudomonadota bacterium]